MPFAVKSVMVSYFIGVHITNRKLHGRLEIESSLLKKKSKCPMVKKKKEKRVEMLKGTVIIQFNLSTTATFRHNFIAVAPLGTTGVG